ncbi:MULTISPECIES: cytidine deaminase [Alteromonadaceae]|uniref:cytidine deaminase n=1 Tax=Alteromonadaceae TaxID=72275 RepID=UPI001C09AEB7|nr:MULTISPECIES: cytidine deaminase [Aliiglaciecola]MBU2878279.1 cytidine deaminase [Aliiglaciecola lipolytica]MDO6711809.1 cytidine deaminase [Aliiglaciecola sp. 2_MG-2023]MDO6753017.1 cytidine deaminase [Aliiglaciecola sp. 1_MG-2023]
MENNTKKLIQAAKQAQQNSYSPYSNFKVGSAILADNGKVYAGCNIENAAYPLGQCAEAGAIAAMILDGGKKIVKILVASPNEKICPPCGGCRQKIKEFADQDTEILMYDTSDNVKTVDISTLLPFAFELD